jgi:hypothetical protein
MSKTWPLVQSYSATVTNSITSANWILRTILAFIDMTLLLAVECPLTRIRSKGFFSQRC